MRPSGASRAFAAASKLKILAECEVADQVKKGVLLRREGLCSSHLGGVAPGS